METIEIIGPSGAGKTTYVSSLSGSNIHTDRLNTFSRSMLAGSLLQPIPRHKAIAKKIFAHVRPRYEREFLSRFPGLLETTAPIVRNYGDKVSILNHIMSEAAWLEYFSNHLSSEEIFVADDGLYQFHLRLIVIEDWDAGKIMDRLHVPDKFILVDAPPEVCIERQKNRPRGLATRLEGLSRVELINEVEAMRIGSKDFIEEANNRGIEVEIVETK